jgi:hypothetical protein
MDTPITTLEEFVRAALGFDWYYHFSDDHGVWSAGNRKRKEIEAFAAENELAASLWKALNERHSEKFAATELMRQLVPVLFRDDYDNIETPLAFLRDHCFRYQAGHMAHTTLGAAVRDAIAKKIGAPPRYDPDVQDERNEVISMWINEWEQKENERPDA